MQWCQHDSELCCVSVFLLLQGIRFIGEKVVHHPPVFAFHCEGCGWVLEADLEMRNRFWGASIELLFPGVIKLATADGEQYEWNQVTSNG